jgi:hypothetical protein
MKNILHQAIDNLSLLIPGVLTCSAEVNGFMTVLSGGYTPNDFERTLARCL